MLAHTSTTPIRPDFALPLTLTTAWRFSPPLVVFVGASLTLLIAGLIGLVVDPRIVVGMPNWAKSVKFGISLALYGLALLWLLPLATRWPRLTAGVAHATGILLIVEVVLLAVQAARGRAMHFNVATPLDTMLWQVMSGTIMLFWAVTLVGAMLLVRQSFSSPVIAWSVRLGFVITIVGLTQGFLMPGPNAAQQAALAAGQQLDLIGAHTVGGFDGGPGLPLLGWSIEHGDLRIGHFVGIHAIQVLPLLGALLLAIGRRRLPTGHQVALVWAAALAYLGLVVLVTWQALRDQPLLAPDVLTLGASASLIGVATLAAGLITAHGAHVTRLATPE